MGVLDEGGGIESTRGGSLFYIIGKDVGLEISATVLLQALCRLYRCVNIFRPCGYPYRSSTRFLLLLSLHLAVTSEN